MIPFQVSLRPGVPIYEQVIYAAKKAILSGAMGEGERFPSVRTLSLELKINPNTAHKVISLLVADRLLEVHPGLGTIVARRNSTAAERASLLNNEVEQLVVEAKTLGLALDDLLESVAKHWTRLGVKAAR